MASLADCLAVLFSVVVMDLRFHLCPILPIFFSSDVTRLVNSFTSKAPDLSASNSAMSLSISASKTFFPMHACMPKLSSDFSMNPDLFPSS
eukprot:CAMPEP_0118666834 /NCGR_PEP_ID=MMETSP0785-20121206/19440_1 /TAXON_ID=91992 /ORGANISM="Bolidomonas pacifica, Strain CCMP 1866" /LENGTH=90 /DNA_ID=CAMNT_0006561199 /DNA_START=267 /DNA_END=536 /DNA_ORIENTATION=-